MCINTNKASSYLHKVMPNTPSIPQQKEKEEKKKNYSKSAIKPNNPPHRKCHRKALANTKLI